MSIEKQLQSRSNSTCELCGSEEGLTVYTVAPASKESMKDSIYACKNCVEQIESPEKMEANHWRCLNDSMWSETPAVQVIAWRMLHRLKKEGWPQDLLDMLYLEEETLEWAKATGEDVDDSEKIIHVDSNGGILQAGDSVVLIKDLNVKGANFTAKRGDFMRNISLVHDNAEQIEGKVNGQHIVVLTKYVKKTK
ncbi:PhnA domain-containing protein [Aureivirga marina]|uniref:PhnA domain-containing protein n=1 Tax=Aureivirga marina TaxID=1182451 RepID=UPI0018C9C36A|nr:alkylphosphonate utilization protein [Aureivirga marina]